MKRISNYILVIIFSLLVANSCSDKGDIPNSAVLTSEIVPAESMGQFMKITSDGEWTIAVIASSPDGWVDVSPTSGKGSNPSVMVTHSQNESTQKRTADIRVLFLDGQSITLHIEQLGNSSGGDPGSGGGDDPGSGGGDDPGSGGGDDPGSGGGDDPESDMLPHSWLELPYVEESDSWMYVSHHTKLQNKEVRNYSMCYDIENRVALWIAYPLCSMYMGSQGRSDAWDYDPKIPQEYQPMLYSGWPEGGYDRGHQIPSGSRNASYHENSQTFYFTNMTAQVSKFNQGIWANLENKVRGYASSCDTLYVVTGPVLTTATDSSIDYTEDRAGNKVAVPKAYFKVLLKYNISSNTYYSIGFYFDNEKYSRSEASLEDIFTVSEVENLTGIEFFNNLPDDIEESVKNQFEPSKWGFN